MSFIFKPLLDSNVFDILVKVGDAFLYEVIVIIVAIPINHLCFKYNIFNFKIQITI